MKKTGLIAIALALGIAGSQVPRFLHAGIATAQSAAPAEQSLADLADQAINADSAISKPAIDKLRAAGTAGLDALMNANKDQINIHRSGVIVFGVNKADDRWPRITTALDAVAAQHDAYASGLYWYTDLAAAETAAKASGKPILSLRLLGNLSDEYSCANSRFFRTVLYANTEVSKHLRENYILHWQSVRPVPVITIDFGDGRKIRRTITGNSIHYVLTADGTVVDAIPGLYGPKAFLRELSEAVATFDSLKDQAPPSQAALLERYHSDQAIAIDRDYRDDLSRAGIRISSMQVQRSKQGSESAPPTAAAAVPLTATKARVERTVVAALSPDASISAQITDADWQRIAALHADDATLDPGSHALMEAKTIDAVQAAKRAMSKSIVEDPLVKTVANFQRSIAEDTVRNEYLYHLQIHRWLADPATTNLANDVNVLNKRVYAELFLTPDNDPWLGLVPKDTYTALDGGGVCH